MIGLVVLGLLFAVPTFALRFMWVAGSDPKLAGTLIAHVLEATWLQAVATILTAMATVALWVVTSKLSRVTAVQVHAQTAPLITVTTYLAYDPPYGEPDPSFETPAYQFNDSDAGIVEINAYHKQSEVQLRQYEASVAAGVEASTLTMPRRSYLVVRIFNSQMSNAYGFATDLEIGVVFSFPRISTIQGGSPSTVLDSDHVYDIVRTLKIPILYGQTHTAVAAVRVDAVPFWSYRVESVSYRDFKGKHCSFAVGTGSGNFSPGHGLVSESRRWNPSPGEQPS